MKEPILITSTVSHDQLVEAIAESGLDTADEVDLVIAIVERMAPWFAEVEARSVVMQDEKERSWILDQRVRLRDAVAKALADDGPQGRR